MPTNSQFANGTLAQRDSADTADAFVRSSIRRHVDADGVISSRIFTYDTNDIATARYVGGTLATVLFKDVSDMRG